MLSCICLENIYVDHRRPQDVVKTSMTDPGVILHATVLFSPHYDIICDQLLNQHTVIWNLFVDFSCPQLGIVKLNLSLDKV